MLHDANDLPADWVCPEATALALRPSLMGLPLNYVAVMSAVCLWAAVISHYVLGAAAAWGMGVVLGRLVTAEDPWAWELLYARLRVPVVLHP